MAQNRVLAVGTVLVVGAAGAVALRQLTDDGRETAPAAPPAGIGTRLDLPTSSWEHGDDAMAAQGGGVLRIDGRDCVYLAGPVRWYAAWPAGYTAFSADGDLTLYDAAGDAVAHDGDRLELGGGYVPVTSDSEHRCLPPTGEEYFVVQSEVRVVRAD